MNTFTVLYSLISVILLIRFYFQKVYNYWKSRNVPTPDFNYIVGNLGPSLELKKTLGGLYSDIYNNYKGYNYVGFYNFTKPSLLIRNPNIIHDILVKNFDSFQDNDINANVNADVLLRKNLCAQNGNKWKENRAKLSPHFTSSKIESLMPLMVENAKQLVSHLEQYKSGFKLEVRDLAIKLVCDNTSSCVFGLDGCCLADSDDEFLGNARSLMKPSKITGFKIIIGQIFPIMSFVLKVKFVPNKIKSYFKNIVTKTIEYRKENNISRNDFLDFMLPLVENIKNGSSLSLDDVTATCASFLLDGFETSASAISFALYEIASNAEIQEKLRKEIDDVVEKHDDEFTYEALEEMIYLDCVLKENLRKNPPVLAITRTCTKPYKLPPVLENSSGKPLHIKPGIPVIIPIEALHMDDKLFPEPTEFIPDRFSRKIRGTIKKGSYLPFGDGPRVCLGRHFGILQTKIAIAALVSNYDLSVHNKTKEPLELDPGRFLRTPVGGIWLKFSRRK